MPTLTINGVAITDFAQAFGAANGFPTAGNYYALEPYGQPPRAGFKTYREIPVMFPGVDGIALKRMGGGARSISADLLIAGASKAAVGTAFAALDASFTQLARYTITMPEGTAYQGCKLPAGGGSIVGWMTIGTAFVALVRLNFLQYSETN